MFARRRMWSERPKMKYDNRKSLLRVEFRNNATLLFDGLPYNPTLRLVGVRQIRKIAYGEEFNIKGIEYASFTHTTRYSIDEDGTTIAGSGGRVSAMDVRPWLRDDMRDGRCSGKCMNTKRQGSFGHYDMQYDDVSPGQT